MLAGEEDLCMTSEAADLPISPILTINEADMSAAMGHDELQWSGMCARDEARPVITCTTPKFKQKKVTSDDVLRLQYETLKCKKETLLLKKAKLELQIKLLEKQLP